MAILAAIFSVIGFIIACYEVGNYFNDTFDCDLRTKLVSGLHGIWYLVVIGFVGLLCMGVFTIAYNTFN